MVESEWDWWREGVGLVESKWDWWRVSGTSGE